MSRMPKLSMEIEPVEAGLPVDSYLQKPALPSSAKPAKKKRVMSEKQLENLAKAREKSAENRRLKKEQKVADKLALKEEKKKKGRRPMPTIQEEDNDDVAVDEEGEIQQENYVEESPYDTGDNGIDYEFIMSNVYGMLKEDQVKQQEEKVRVKKEEEDYVLRKNAYDDTIRADERARLKGVVEEQQKHKKNYAPMVNGGSDWDKCFQPRGRGGDNFF